MSCTCDNASFTLQLDPDYVVIWALLHCKRIVIVVRKGANDGVSEIYHFLFYTLITINVRLMVINVINLVSGTMRCSLKIFQFDYTSFYSASSIRLITTSALISRLAASGMTREFLLSITSSVTMRPRRTGRQCINLPLSVHDMCSASTVQ